MGKITKKQLPKDSAYKKPFSHPEMVESLLRVFVPEKWVDQIDFTSLRKGNGSYVADNLSQRQDDLIWCLKIRDQERYIYLLLEFQSSVDTLCLSGS
jgi:predicted transposase YdaD